MSGRLFALTLLSGVLILSVVVPSTAAATPWVPDPGSGYVKVWTRWLPGFNYFDGDGQTRSYGAYHEVFVSGYGEIGLANGLGLVVHSDLVRIFSLTDPQSETSSTHLAPGDPSLGLNVQLAQEGRFVSALTFSVRAPLASDTPVAEVRGRDAPHPVVADLIVGSGVWDVAVAIETGYGFDDAFLAASVGTLVRSGGYDSALSWSAAGGYTFGGGFAGRLRISGYHSLSTGRAPRTDSPSGIGNGTSYVGFALEGDYEWTEGFYVGLSFEGGLGLIERQTGGPVISLSLSHAF